MRAFFEGIQWLFENVLFLPHNYLRKLELSSWFAANIINWLFMIVCAVAMVYWCKQLKFHKDNHEEDQDTTAHSFLK
ncbi:MAG: uracil phosphoribosyltransferase [Burkholderiales bacterium]|nr:uracil phosphoribosyltransferase [Flavobacterium sp.]